jgi:hypothetical protein
MQRKKRPCRFSLPSFDFVFVVRVGRVVSQRTRKRGDVALNLLGPVNDGFLFNGPSDFLFYSTVEYIPYLPYSTVQYMYDYTATILYCMRNESHYTYAIYFNKNDCIYIY